MRLFVVIVAFCLYGVVLWSQEVTSSHYVIEVNQRFNSSNHCDGGYPSLSKATFTIDDSTQKKEECKVVRHSDSYFTAKASFNLDKNSYNTFTSIEFYDETRGIGRKGNTFTDSKTIPKSDLQIGENIITPNCEGSAKCSPRHTEGYTIRTSIIIDNPIDIEVIGEKESYSVEKDELLLQLDDFYENGKGFEIQYKCENADIKNWQRIYNNNKKITSGGLLSLRYEDIVGKFSDSNKAYNDCSGKVIGLRIVKTLLDQTKTCGNTIEVRFCFQGPDFYVENIRRPECNHGNIDIRVIVTPGTSNYKMDDSTFTNYSWVISKKGDSTSPTIGVSNGVSKVKFEPEGNNRYKLAPEGEIINNDNVESDGGSYLLQLQVLDEYGNPKDLDFAFREFSIPSKLDPIRAWQSKDYLFELDGKKYHLFNKNEPYVVLNITDDDHSELGRMPYKIYDSAGKLLAEITDTIKIDTDALRADFEKKNNYDDLAREWAKEWFVKNKEKAKVEFIDEIVSSYEGSTRVKPVLVMHVGEYPNIEYTYISYDYSSLYRIKGEWKSDYNSNKVNLGNQVCYIGTDDDNNSESYVLYIENIDGNGGYNVVSPKDIGEITQGNNCFILLGSKNAYTLLDINNEKYVENCSSIGNLNFSDADIAYISYNGDVITIEDGSIVLYKYDDSNNNWGAGETISTQFCPKSAKNVAFEGNYNNVKYTASDGNSYREYNNITEDTFIGFWDKGNAVNLPKDAFQERYERLWKQYYLQNAGYHVHGIKINTEKEEELTLVDNDGCPYTILYRVNVLDGPKVEFEDGYPRNPEGKNLANGEAKLRVYPGGDNTYYYNGKKIEGKLDIYLTGLHWGDNSVEFTNENGDVRYTHIVSLLPNVTFTTTPQTCSSPNGEISPNGKDAKECTSWQHKNPSMPDSDEYWENGLDNLKAGTYAVRGKFGNLWVNFREYTVANEVFSVEVNKVKDAAEIGGTGSVELKIENQTKDITWTDIDTKATYTDYKQAIFTARKYNWTITHDGCKLPIEFEIKAPKVELVNSWIEHDVDNKKITVHMEGKKDDDGLISSYQFTLDGKPFDVETTITNLQDGKESILRLEYSTKNVKQTPLELCKISHKVDFSPNAFADTTYNAKRCPSQPGRVTLSGASGGELAVDNSNQYKKIEKDGSLDIPNNPNDTIHTLHFRKTETISANYDFGEIENTIVHDVSNVVIAEPKQPYIRIAKSDVTCKGSKGELYIDDAQNVRGEAQYSFDKKNWLSDTIKGQVPKVYRIYTRDSECTSDIDSCDIEIEEPSNPLQVSIPNDDIFNPTCRDNDGKIVISAKGGWGDYLAYTSKLTAEEYESLLDTSNIEKNLRIENLKSGDHAIYVHDGGGCVVEVNADLKQYDSPQITDTTTIPARCYGSADGEIVINAVTVDCSIEDKPLSLLIEGRSDTLILTNPYKTTIKDLSKGFYKLQLMDVNGCQSDILNVPISEPKPLKVEARLLDGGRIQYKGGNKGRMEVKVSGGNAGIDSVFYNNSNVLVSTGVPYIVGGMSAGPIVISANDKNGCPSNDTTLTFIEPDEPITIEAESQAALCHAMTGSVKVTATGGWGDHIIRLVGERESRNSGDKSETTFESLYAGDYKIEVEDKYGATATQSVRVDAPEPISHELITTPDNCDGNGSATIKLSGGMPDYTTIFVVGTDTTKIAGSTVNIGNLVGGREYTLATRDANTCESVITFPQPDNRLKAEIKYAYNANGSATLTAEVKGGIAPYIYKWRNVSGGKELGTSSTQTVTKSGLYRLEIADASGCSYKTMQDVLMAGSIVMRVKSVTRATNPENKNGTATIICKATQEVNLRLYHLETDTWTSSITMQDETINLEDLQWGHYCVEGELDNGNMQTAMFEIAPYVEMKVIKTAVKHVSAPGRNDASVVVDFEGGIAPYVLNNATYPTGHIELENLAAGKITLSIADSTGNILTKDVEILEPEQPLVVTPSRVDSASCYSYYDGSVQLTATGGWPDYQYAKGDEEYKISAYFGGLNAGERTFKVVDKYGVEDSVKVTIGEPDLLRASVATIDSVKCHGDNDGAAHFTVTGGTAPYRTIYEKETLDGTDVKYLLSGSYVMKFTDSHQCKSPDTISIYIPEPDLLVVANDEVVHTTCELNNGKIAIEVKGGSLPYRYKWTENDATYGGAKTVNMVRSEAENLKQNGLYQVDIIDLHGCHTKYEKRIERSENPRVLGVATTDVLCYGSSDGIAEVDSSQVKWGYPKVNYHLTWPQGQTGVMSVNTLPAGRHTVRITDDNNCTTTREFTVGTPEPVKNHLASVRDALCYSYSDGRIETHTTGGVGDYTYVWNTGETTSYADSLKAGLYTIVVTDSHECKDSATYEVTEPEELKVNLGDDVLICPGNIHVFDAGEYATYSWRSVASGEEIETERFFATGDEGDYAIKVTNEIGCIARDTVNMAIGENALVANFLMASDAAVNDTIMLVELANMPVDSVRWEYNPLTVVDIDDADSYILNLSAENTGRYYITMWAYSGGCEAFEQKFIDIYEAVADTNDFKIGYDPLIKQAKVSPNPNDGEFDLIVVLRETSDIDVTVYDVNNGRQVEHVVLKNSSNYNTRLNIKQWGSGIFVLSVVSGTERRAIKVLCVR
ncbi:MAG: T9SS type A sorting domain-containing protein [Bacteroidales bacterium]|nr:T9SS type A sorting domain-containing protein [Bacteroidales bacterium]